MGLNQLNTNIKVEQKKKSKPENKNNIARSVLIWKRVCFLLVVKESVYLRAFSWNREKSNEKPKWWTGFQFDSFLSFIFCVPFYCELRWHKCALCTAICCSIWINKKCVNFISFQEDFYLRRCYCHELYCTNHGKKKLIDEWWERGRARKIEPMREMKWKAIIFDMWVLCCAVLCMHDCFKRYWLACNLMMLDLLWVQEPSSQIKHSE